MQDLTPVVTNAGHDLYSRGSFDVDISIVYEIHWSLHGVANRVAKRLGVSIVSTEAVVRRMMFYKKVFLKVSPNSQENTFAGISFFNKAAALQDVTFLKKLWDKCFPVVLVKFLVTLFSTEHLHETVSVSKIIG